MVYFTEEEGLKDEGDGTDSCAETRKVSVSRGCWTADERGFRFVFAVAGGWGSKVKRMVVCSVKGESC